MEKTLNNYENKPTFSCLGMIIWTALIATIFGTFWFAIRLYFCYGNLQCIFANNWVRDERYKREKLEEEKNKQEEPVKEFIHPAREFCMLVGWTSIIKTKEDGSEYWVCKTPEGNEVDEWELYNNAIQEQKRREIIEQPNSIEQNQEEQEHIFPNETNGVDNSTNIKPFETETPRTEAQQQEEQSNEDEIPESEYDKEWNIVKSFIGLPMEFAVERAKELGLEFRITSVDWRLRTITKEYNPNRINVDIEKDIVKRASLG